MLSVLIVEDNILLADILEDFLELGGYSVCGVAQNVAEAVELADLHAPDLAIIDFRLPNGELGSQIAPRLKNQNRMGILYATADTLNRSLTRLDGEAYIRKPFMMEELLQALHIVQELKEEKNVEFYPFPRNFHILRPPSGQHQGAA